MPSNTISTPSSNLPHHHLIPVEGGTFQQGEEKKTSQVKVDSFQIGQYPVTQDLWKAVMGKESNPSRFYGGNRPVETVSWYDACVFCNRLSEQEGLMPTYYVDEKFRQVYGKKGNSWALPNKGKVFWKNDAQGYRLPSEAEWEYAARGGKKKEDYPYAGGSKLKELGWYDDNSYGETKPVGLKYPNQLGLYDMSGNVFEWCWDTSGVSRVFRGGNWGYDPRLCRVTYRNGLAPGDRGSLVGFRLGFSLQ